MSTNQKSTESTESVPDRGARVPIGCRCECWDPLQDDENLTGVVLETGRYGCIVKVDDDCGEWAGREMTIPWAKLLVRPGGGADRPLSWQRAMLVGPDRVFVGEVTPMDPDSDAVIVKDPRTGESIMSGGKWSLWVCPLGWEGEWPNLLVADAKAKAVDPVDDGDVQADPYYAISSDLIRLERRLQKLLPGPDVEPEALRCLRDAIVALGDLSRDHRAEAVNV